MGNKVVGIIVTVAFFVLVALVGYRLYQEQSESQEASAPPATEQGEQATAPEPDDKAGAESASDTEAAQEDSASGEDETANSSSDAGVSGSETSTDADSASAQDDAPDTENASDTSADIPTFDVVRIEPTGEGVIAGRSEPSWDIEIQSNGKSIAETTADPVGQWSLVLDEPLGEGEHSLSIVATSPDGEKSLTSQQKVLVSMGDEQSDKTVVALREPGKATQILQEDAAGDESGATADGDTASGTADKASADNGDAESEQKIAAADMKDQSRPDEDENGSPSGDDMSASSTANDEDEGQNAMSEEEAGGAEGDKAASDTTGESASDSAASDEAASSGADEASSGDTVEAKKAGDDTPASPQPTVRIKTVDYEDQGDESGQIIVTGTSTEPSTDILLYLDGELIAEGQTQSDGGWKIDATKYLAPGNRMLQVDLVNRSEDKILGRAAVGMRRQTPPPVAKEVAEAESGPADESGEGEAEASSSSEKSSGSASSAESGRPEKSDRVAGDRATSGASDMSAPPEEQSTADASDSSASPDSQADQSEQSTADAVDVPDPDRAPGEEIPDPDRAPGDMASAEADAQSESTDSDGPEVYTVRRGDTLWAIAEEHFGGGWRYTMIFKDNRGKIRNPHWIYPDQQFEIRKD